MVLFNYCSPMASYVSATYSWPTLLEQPCATRQQHNRTHVVINHMVPGTWELGSLIELMGWFCRFQLAPIKCISLEFCKSGYGKLRGEICIRETELKRKRKYSQKLGRNTIWSRNWQTAFLVISFSTFEERRRVKPTLTSCRTKLKTPRKRLVLQLQLKTHQLLELLEMSLLIHHLLQKSHMY